MSELDCRTFLKEYTRAIRDENAALFVGAGISRAAGYVDWKQLLREVAEDLDLDIDRETDLIALAQFHVNHRKGRDRLNQLLMDEFLEDAELTTSHGLIASLPIHTVWTTNYDDLLELAYSSAKKRTDVKRRPADFSTTRRRVEVEIYKMHGDKTDPSGAVLTKEDYETYDRSRELFTIALKGDLAQKTFLFLGFSFADPNVMYVLSRVRQLLDVNGRKHYCVIKPPTASDYADKDFGAYECKRFSHWLIDLHRYNIQPVLISRYDEVPEVLRELNRRSHLRDVFLSGSAADYSPLGEAKFHELCRALGGELIRKEFNLISGFGLGVADTVIVGAMSVLQRNDDERLQLWPFPQSVPDDIDRATFWRSYRERIINNAGVCLVLAGNKRLGETVIPADGVRQEVEIALSQGKAVIPIGATGHIAMDLWKQCSDNQDKFLGISTVGEQLRVIGDQSQPVQSIVTAVLEILKALDR